MKKIATIAVAISCAAVLLTACSGKTTAKGGAASCHAQARKNAEGAVSLRHPLQHHREI